MSHWRQTSHRVIQSIHNTRTTVESTAYEYFDKWIGDQMHFPRLTDYSRPVSSEIVSIDFTVPLLLFRLKITLHRIDSWLRMEPTFDSNVSYYVFVSASDCYVVCECFRLAANLSCTTITCAVCILDSSATWSIGISNGCPSEEMTVSCGNRVMRRLIQFKTILFDWIENTEYSETT